MEAYERFFEIEAELLSLREELEWFQKSDKWVSEQRLSSDMPDASVLVGDLERPLHPLIRAAAEKACRWYNHRNKRKRALRAPDLFEAEGFNTFWQALEEVKDVGRAVTDLEQQVKELEREQREISAEAAAAIGEKGLFEDIVEVDSSDYRSLGFSGHDYARAVAERYKIAFEGAGLDTVEVVEKRGPGAWYKKYVVRARCRPEERRILRNIPLADGDFKKLLRSKSLCEGVATKHVNRVMWCA